MRVRKLLHAAAGLAGRALLVLCFSKPHIDQSLCVAAAITGEEHFPFPLPPDLTRASYCRSETGPLEAR